MIYRVEKQAAKRWGKSAGFCMTAAVAAMIACAMPARAVENDGFIVNQTTAGVQDRASTAINNNGAFVVAWRGETDGGSAIYARRYNANGSAGSGEIIVASGDDLINPSVGIDESGNSVVVWTDDNNGNVLARRYNAAGTAQGAAFPVNEAGTSGFTVADNAVAVAPDGAFVVAFEEYGEEDSEVVVRRYNASGSAQGAPQQVSMSGDDYGAAVSISDTHAFVVSWTKDGGENGSSVVAQRFNSGGSKTGGEITVSANGGFSEDSSVSLKNDGQFVVVWESFGDDDTDILAREYKADGTPRTAAFQVNQSVGENENPDVALNEDGNYGVVWGGETDGGFPPLGAQLKLGGIFVSTEGTVGDGEFDSFTPAVALNDDDQFVVAGDVRDGSEDSPDIFALLAEFSGGGTTPPVGPPGVTTATTREDTSATIPLKTASGTSFRLGTEPVNGTVEIVGDQAFYTPDDDFNGTDVFTVIDNKGVVLTVKVTVTAVNDAPVADAGEDQLILIDAKSSKTSVKLDGSDSFDVDNDKLTYTWREGSSVIATGVNPKKSFLLGTHTVTLTVTDPSGASSTDTVLIRVARKPVVIPQSLTVSGSGTLPISATATKKKTGNLSVNVIQQLDRNGFFAVRGSVVYSDQERYNAIRLDQGVQVNGNQATISGEMQINNGRTAPFTLTINDIAGKGAGFDTFILEVNGQRVAGGVISKGNFTIAKKTGKP